MILNEVIAKYFSLF